jgi:hypothetical protein
VAAALTGIGVNRYEAGRAAARLNEQALALATSSETQVLRLLPAAPTVPAGAHGTYRYEPGVPLVVATVELPSAPSGRTYRMWALFKDSATTGSRRVAIGTVRPDATGHARIIAQGTTYQQAPQALEVTLEPNVSGHSPAGPVALRWPAP